MLAPLLYKMRANILKRGLLRITSDFAVDLVAVIIAFARSGEIDWTAPDCLGCFLNDFLDATIVSVAEL